MTRGRKHFGAERVVQGEAPRVDSQMNVTPLIDILLVLLVIFMAALPMTQKGFDVALPPIVAAGPVAPTDGQIVVEVTADRQVSINRQDVPQAELGSRLQRVFETRRDKTLYVMGAGSLRYRDIVTVIDVARGAGVDRVGIVTEGMRLTARPDR